MHKVSLVAYLIFSNDLMSFKYVKDNMNLIMKKILVYMINCVEGRILSLIIYYVS